MAREVLALPRAKHVDIDYDREADVLYISFGKPQAADDSDLTDNDIIVRYRRGELIGITVLDFQRRVDEQEAGEHSGAARRR